MHTNSTIQYWQSKREIAIPKCTTSGIAQSYIGIWRLRSKPKEASIMRKQTERALEASMALCVVDTKKLSFPMSACNRCVCLCVCRVGKKRSYDTSLGNKLQRQCDTAIPRCTRRQESRSLSQEWVDCDRNQRSVTHLCVTKSLLECNNTEKQHCLLRFNYEQLAMTLRNSNSKMHETSGIVQSVIRIWTLRSKPKRVAHSCEGNNNCGIDR